MTEPRGPDGPAPGERSPADPVAPTAPGSPAPGGSAAAGDPGPDAPPSAAAEPQPPVPAGTPARWPGATGPAPDKPGPPEPDERGTVEFGETGFPTPPGYPPYGPPAYAPAHSGVPAHPGTPASPATLPAGAPPPGKRRHLLIASVVLGVVLLLCGGGGLTAFLLLRGGDGDGAPDPVAATDGFLRAVYLDRDVTEAAALVCPAARDKAKITKKIEEIEGYGTTYPNPRFRWTPPVVADQNSERAVVTTRLTMITGDERFAEQQLTLTVVDQAGWWVCEVA
ncbi:hypothetical protein [Plantactinospora sp. KBS50]|uniref:Rv0361 family membrane protein n=1 Tax=Plantactinospora sp. KBS50 TaxID=2024580 RepID=UPI0018E0622B|nr:hypothetical protein [Plantactinospora sp. KBS50]